VRLWQTPGVPGAWVGTEPVLDGELVDLLSRPQFSEGVDGEEFVLVGRACGERGWLRVKDVCSPPLVL